jgi:PilZ domain-containing protein
MLKEGQGSEEGAGEGSTGSPADRRRTRRRRLPFGRGAVLETTRSSHVVAVVDLSEGGAYVATRAPFTPGHAVTLRILLTVGHELSLPAEVVRVCSRREPGPDAYPPGVAIRFLDLEPRVATRLARFVEDGRKRQKS